MGETIKLDALCDTRIASALGQHNPQTSASFSQWFGRGRILSLIYADFRPLFRLGVASPPGIPCEIVPD
jgi:hypothetical protein